MYEGKWKLNLLAGEATQIQSHAQENPTAVWAQCFPRSCVWCNVPPGPQMTGKTRFWRKKEDERSFCLGRHSLDASNATAWVQATFLPKLKLMSEMSNIGFFDVFYGQFTIAVAGGGGGGALPYWAIRDVPGFGSPFSTKVSERGWGMSGIPEPGRISQQFSSQLAFLENVSLISFSKNDFWLNQFIFNNRYFYQTVEIDHIIMFFRLATLPTSRNFSKT